MINYLGLLAVPTTIVIAKLITFLFDIILSSYYGAGLVSDAFIMANALPTILVDGLIVAIITCYIPILQKIRIFSPNDERKFNCNILILSLLFSSFVLIILLLFSKNIVSVYANGFSKEGKILLAQYIEIIAWCIPFIIGAAVFRGYLQVINKKALSNAHQIINYIVLIITLLVTFPKHFVLPYGVVLGSCCSLLFLVFFSLKNGFRILFYVNLYDENLKKMFVMIFPVLLSTVIGEINSLADRYFSSFLDKGIITSMALGYKLSFSFQGIVSSSLMIILFPILSKKFLLGNIKEFNNHLMMAIKIISWIIFPIIFMCFSISKELVTVLFGHGNFNYTNIEITTTLFEIYLLGVFPMCMKNISDKAFYAIGKTGYTLGTSILSVCINIVLNYLVYQKYHYIGLALVTSFSITMVSFIQWLLLKYVDKNVIKMEYFSTILKPLIVSFVMFSVIKVINSIISTMLLSEINLILIDMVIGLLYIASCKFIFNDDYKQIKEYLKVIK